MLVGTAMRPNFSYVIDKVLAGMSCPGRADDLAADLALLSDQGIGAIVSLTLEPLGAELVREQGFRYLHLPVGDFRSPTLKQIEEFVAFVDDCRRLSGEAGAGCPVVVHCDAGMGRTGTFLACYLVSRETPPAGAIKKVRALRPGSIETAEQEDIVFAYAVTLG